MYRITYEIGNGYRCGCCRSTWTNTIDFETHEEVKKWVTNLYASKKVPLYEDEDDRDIESIEKEFGIDIQDEFEPKQEELDLVIAERQKVIDDKKDKEEKEKEKRKYEYYLKLKNKYEKDEN